MRIKILHGSEAGQIQDFPPDDNNCQWMLDTGYAELAPAEPEAGPRVPLDDFTVAELEDLMTPSTMGEKT